MTFEIDPNKQYILAGDISGSMESADPACGGNTRYSYMLEKFEQFIKASEDFDPDGPTVLLFGESVQVFQNTNLEAVKANLSNPTFEGWTNTHAVIEKAWELHQAEKAAAGSHPGTVLMVFTDGSPTNRKAVAETIVKIANTIERDEEFSIAFLTVGTIDADLAAYLEKLDDELQGNGGAKYDIVDVKPLEQVNFLKAVAGAISD
jgi:hypothetical protein